jgi:hypothetical protein
MRLDFNSDQPEFDQTNKQFNVTLSAFEYYLLRKWAKNHNKPTAQYAAQIISARLEANTGWNIQEWEQEMRKFYAWYENNPHALDER